MESQKFCSSEWQCVFWWLLILMKLSQARRKISRKRDSNSILSSVLGCLSSPINIKVCSWKERDPCYAVTHLQNDSFTARPSLFYHFPVSLHWSKPSLHPLHTHSRTHICTLTRLREPTHTHKLTSHKRTHTHTCSLFLSFSPSLQNWRKKEDLQTESD